MENKKISWWQPALMLSLKFSGWIIFPVVAAVYLGRWLDRKYQTEPWLFLACVGLAFLISMVGLIKNVLAEYQKIELDNQATKKDKIDDAS